MRHFLKVFALYVWCAAWLVTPMASAMAAEVLPGPIPAQLIRVIDGDTVEVRARIWLGQDVEVAVRLAGIDAPERRGKCLEEQALAEAATVHVMGLQGEEVLLWNVTADKFGGRVQAEVSHAEMGGIGVSLLNAGLARVYHGGRRGSWCSALASTE